MIEQITIRGFTPQGDAAESFDITNSLASWKSPVDAGSTKYQQPAMYVTFGGPADPNVVFDEALIAAPGKSLRLLPGGEAHAAPLTTLTVGSGAQQQTIQAYSITGLSNAPFAIWMDAKGKFFAQYSGLAWIRAGYESALPQLDKAQDEALAKGWGRDCKESSEDARGSCRLYPCKAFVDGTRICRGPDRSSSIMESSRKSGHRPQPRRQRTRR